jgi:hypothetical protein
MGTAPSAKKHSQMVLAAVDWLRHAYGCGIVLSEQYCATGEIPDAIGWKGFCHSVIVECKVSRPDFLADGNKPFRTNPAAGLGCERFYLAPPELIAPEELPPHWGLLQYRRGEVRIAVKAGKNLLLASLRRVEVRIEPRTITQFLKWKNRMADYNGGALPSGLVPPEHEDNTHLRL